MTSTLVLGGTGLLGSHTITELLKHGYDVTAVSLPGSDNGTLPAEVEAVWENLCDLPDEQVLDLFSGKHAVFYAIGADERTVPAIPAAHFFYEANVVGTQRIARLARQAGVKKFVLYGSYTAEMGERWTDFPYGRDPYPRTRLAQEEIACLEGEGAMDVMTLRLPYIFGLVGGQRPLWQFVIDTVTHVKPIVGVLGGTTSAVTARQVGQAAVGAMERGEHGGKYAINAYDLSYLELNRLACEAIGRDPEDVKVVPLQAVLPAYAARDEECRAKGVEHGVPVVHTAEFQNRHAVNDPAQTMDLLGIEQEDVVAAIVESFRWCVEHPVERPAA